jgi:hypothetical protein
LAVRGGEQLLKNDLPGRGIFRNSGIVDTRFGLLTESSAGRSRAR